MQLALELNNQSGRILAQGSSRAGVEDWLAEILVNPGRFYYRWLEYPNSASLTTYIPQDLFKRWIDSRLHSLRVFGTTTG